MGSASDMAFEGGEMWGKQEEEEPTAKKETKKTLERSKRDRPPCAPLAISGRTPTPGAWSSGPCFLVGVGCGFGCGVELGVVRACGRGEALTHNRNAKTKMQPASSLQKKNRWPHSRAPRASRCLVARLTAPTQ